MKALKITGSGSAILCETHKPESHGTSPIIKVSKCAVCGSDIHFYELGGPFSGAIIGHEFTGVIDDPGNSKFNKGDRVTAIPMDPCRTDFCPQCSTGNWHLCPQNGLGGLGQSPFTPGAMAEYVRVREDLIVKLPVNVDLTEGAMIEAASVALRAVRNTGVEKGESILITGGGCIGTMSAYFAKAAGAGTVVLTDNNSAKIEQIKSLGDADHVLNPESDKFNEEMKKIAPKGFDRAIDAVGIRASVATALDYVKEGGVIGIVGICFFPQPFDGQKLLEKKIRIHGSFAYKNEFQDVVDMLSEDKISISKFVSHTSKLEEADKTIEKMAKKEINATKMVVDCE